MLREGSTKLSHDMSAAPNAQEGTSGFAALDAFLEERLRSGALDLYDETLRRMERLLLTRVLQHTGGNQLQAAKLLGITRGSLRTKIRELGITIARSVASPAEAGE
jgi:two-component system nitrogen regulation response regulator GlnG